MPTIRSTFAALTLVTLLGSLGGCHRAHTSDLVASPAALDLKPAANPEAEAILIQNALSSRHDVIALGSGDRFGNRMWWRSVAIIQARFASDPAFVGVHPTSPSD